MTDPARRPFPTKHPLRGNRALLDEITDLMWWEVLKILHQPRRRRGKPGKPELALIGGVSAEDVLQEALFGLLRYEPAEGINWKALGVRIAQNKAKEALRKSRSYRRRPGQSDIVVASVDVADEEGDPLIDQLTDESLSRTLEEAQDELRRLERQRALHRIANEVLPDRDRQIVFRIQRGETRVDLTADFGVTPQRIGQIYDNALRKLHAGLVEDPLFRPPTTNPTEGGNPHDE